MARPFFLLLSRKAEGTRKLCGSCCLAFETTRTDLQPGMDQLQSLHVRFQAARYYHVLELTLLGMLFCETVLRMTVALEQRHLAEYPSRVLVLARFLVLTLLGGFHQSAKAIEWLQAGMLAVTIFASRWVSSGFIEPSSQIR